MVTIRGSYVLLEILIKLMLAYSWRRGRNNVLVISRVKDNPEVERHPSLVQLRNHSIAIPFQHPH
ncbi:MAG TPA: hypothetical protein VJ183_05300 [Chloroflexia bacterium]|nr:hypothetical protein [Chloroflexia bacterium]